MSSCKQSSASHHSRQSSISSQSVSIAEQLLPQSTSIFHRDWLSVTAAELVSGQNIRYVDGEMPVERACEMLVDQNFYSLPIRSSPSDHRVIRTFDYSDVITFLLRILGHGHSAHEEGSIDFKKLVRDAKEVGKVPIRLVGDLGPKNLIPSLEASSSLAKILESFGNGFHHIAVTRDSDGHTIGLLNQKTVLRFLWNNARSFPAIEHFFQKTLRELNIVRKNIIAIAADRKVIEAFELLNTQGISSLAVVDGVEGNLLGNISIVDVKYVTRARSLLQTTCGHFLGVVKYEQGVESGQDSFPVYSVYPSSTLAHTVAKLIATRAHLSSTPVLGQSSANIASLPQTSQFILSPSHPAGSCGEKLLGVASITDILSFFARVAGVCDVDPNEARRKRRASSTSTATTVSERAEIVNRG
ncbi:Protein sds23 [Neolecta irregularis DAH-3]|uniref:Protein sds23 n=1 Tax=Neolecta irregularis (strain DAH-3) TaxID=1198029 RepID=A0A1U7LGW6_NEOID|nr:Protein sds23 [Neolecta irregularis DAH-3]|eukprot:OLL21868.1 Protein sds23 [Neolecta irregularis DAH-3]